MENLDHLPVLHTTVLTLLRPMPGETVLDCTLGLGGHARSLLEAIAPDGRLIALDADGDNIALARERLSAVASRIEIRHANFRRLAELALPPCDIVFADLGLSSPHLDDPARGFSFRHDGPLDLRFDRSQGKTAAEILAVISEEDLVAAFKSYGEFPGVHRLAAALHTRKPTTTFALKQAAEKALGWKAKNLMPQMFQALRILVNDEMGALKSLLRTAPFLLKSGGRLGIISFHSLEDRLVKQAFRSLCDAPKDAVTGKRLGQAPFAPLTKKPLRPDAEEIVRNPRSRSAVFRVISRLS